MVSFRGCVAKALLATVASSTLAGCAGGQVPNVRTSYPTRPTTMESQVGSEFETARPAVRRVRLSGDFFTLKPTGGELPPEISNAKVRLDFAGMTPTFDDLTMLLEDRGLSVIIGWDDGTIARVNMGPKQSQREDQQQGGSGGLQSGSFNQNGNLGMQGGMQGGMMNGMQGGYGMQGGMMGQTTGLGQTNPSLSNNNVQVRPQAYDSAGDGDAEGGSQLSDAVTDLRKRLLPFRRYEGTLGGLFKQLQRSMGVAVSWNDGVYVSPVGRYSVMLPQNKDLMAQVVSELQAKGAGNVVASLQAGTVSFVAPGALAEDVIKPYLVRLARNASEVTMQVALVSVLMNQDAARGFDWSKFNFAFGDPVKEGGTSELPAGGLFSLGTEATRFFAPAVNILGSRRPLDIAGAIKFLSSYGNTAVDQNVELRTLAGTVVNWRSGQTIPYVSGVGASSTGSIGGGLGGNLFGSSNTAQLQTGLSLSLAPSYESAGGLVTVTFKLELVELEQFVNLNAGNQLGSFTQPQTRDQKLDDIVRVPVGETVVLGGLRRQTGSTTRSAPFKAWGIGSKSNKDEVQTVFIIMRPTVTVYETAGLEQPIPSRTNSLQIGSDGRPWQQPESEYRGTTMFGSPVDTAPPAKRRPMRQPNGSGERE